MQINFLKKSWVSIRNVPADFDLESFIREMTSFGALEIFETYKFYSNLMCDLSQLKEFHLDHMDDHTDLEKMAIYLVNLERLWIGGTVNQLSSFIRLSKKLNFITFNNTNRDNNALNLFTLNRVRHMGGNQSKVRIGVDEKQYLVTKWKNKEVDYDFVEITRAERIREHFHYE